MYIPTRLPNILNVLLIPIPIPITIHILITIFLNRRSSLEAAFPRASRSASIPL